MTGSQQGSQRVCHLACQLLAGALVLVAAAAKGAAEPIPLNCRIAQGPWRACVMTVASPGQQWRLQVGSKRFDFRHDGSGQVILKRPGAPLQVVSSRWIAAQTLCWDGVCARGELPLD
ncbi:hypothetical protein [Cyanobium sp. ATX 6F1]|uniref:hypothetical protein n=1 Tax=Cyanobium sp. ATX 6F1 TaxID=2823702 RepID=UPI0020CCE44F|nr:hypothetical protein [Cyanobium sp. ATX 6F1]MCP9916109.1 hypothetical protein [Cyanobium sp. ATX 6F1]